MKVEIWSDIVCPWCYVGKRRFEAAVERFDEEVEVVWRSFELDPAAPKVPPGPLDQALARKYGMSVERARQMMDQMTATAAGEGLELRFDRARGGNTFDAHRLLHLAKAHGLGDAMKERLLRAYMTEGQPIGEVDALVELAAEVGLDADEARTTLEGEAFAEAVREDEAQARAIGIHGVPFFVFEGQFGVSGAQSADALLDVMRRVRDRLGPKSTGGGAVCDEEGCEV